MRGLAYLLHAKGKTVVGSDADVVILDPNAERVISAETHHMAADYNPFEGMKIKGEPVSVLSRGEYVIKDKQFVGKLGTGKYIKRAKYGKLLSNEESEVFQIELMYFFVYNDWLSDQ